MDIKKESIIIKTAFRFAIPFIFLYALYVLTHGEYSPGGGFQAGGLLSIVVILSRLVEGENASINITSNKSLAIAGLGALLYALVGWLAIAFGGQFLEYGTWLPFDLGLQSKHEWGILIIETGVTICVMATIITIFDAITTKGEKDAN